MPVLYAEDLVTKECDIHYARRCSTKYCLNATTLENNIIMCDLRYGLEVDENSSPPAGIISPDVNENTPFHTSFPGAWIPTVDYEVLANYYKSANRSRIRATIHKSETIKGTPYIMGSFSSRGPNTLIPEILKPDIVGPRVGILAATQKGFEILSGTSMACPHVAGAAAYVKSFRPDWSASAIKSALITTAWPMDSTIPGNEEAELAYGSGQVNPTYALTPGLVYETSKNDYIALLSGLGYNKTKLWKIICRQTQNQPDQNIKSILPKDLNYPTMMAVIKPFHSFKTSFERRVTNVGNPKFVYNATVINTNLLNYYNVTFTVSPSILKFKSLKQTKKFRVRLSGGKQPAGNTLRADLVWSDGDHYVRSPIVIYSSVSELSLSSKF